jgi:hypothetical protein
MLRELFLGEPILVALRKTEKTTAVQMRRLLHLQLPEVFLWMRP